jgi:hypothetical protein
MNAAQVALAQRYRDMAAKCREMATLTARPSSILQRAEVFDATAADLEREDDQAAQHRT